MAARKPRMAKVNLSDSLEQPVSDAELESKPEEDSDEKKAILALDKSGELGPALEEHELAHVFPPMNPDEYGSLKYDIHKNGLLQPIYTYEGRIIDGRHRYRAMRELGMTDIPTEEYTGESPFNFVVAMNLNRRHLTPAQRAVVALDLLPFARQDAQRRMQAGKAVDDSDGQTFTGTARDAVGEMLQISGRVIANAEKIAKEAPDLLPEISAGTKSINSALKEINERPNSDGTPRVPATKRQSANPPNEERVNDAIGEMVDYFDMWLKEYGRIKQLKPLTTQVREWRTIAQAARDAGMSAGIDAVNFDVNDYELDDEEEEPSDLELAAIEDED